MHSENKPSGFLFPERAYRPFTGIKHTKYESTGKEHERMKSLGFWPPLFLVCVAVDYIKGVVWGSFPELRAKKTLRSNGAMKGREEGIASIYIESSWGYGQGSSRSHGHFVFGKGEGELIVMGEAPLQLIRVSLRPGRPFFFLRPLLKPKERKDSREKRKARYKSYWRRDFLGLVACPPP